jgi:hypothetical protein
LISDAVRGDGKQFGTDAASFLSFGLRPVTDVLTNQNYRGQQIVSPYDDPKTKALERAGHLTTSYLPSWLREPAKAASANAPQGFKDFLQLPDGGQPAYQTIANMLELPFRYYDSSKIDSGNGAVSSNDIYDSAGKYQDTLDKQNKKLDEFFGPTDNAIRRLNSHEQDALVQTGVISQDKLDSLKKYELQKRQELGMPANDIGQSIPKTVQKNAPDDVKKFYKDKAYISDTDIDAWKKEQASGTAAGLIDRAKGIAAGRPDLPQTNEVADLYADFATRRAKEKWGATKENAEKLKFLKAAYTSTLDPQQKEWFGLSQANLRAAVENGEISKQNLDDLMSFDDGLRRNGLTGEIGNDLRSDYGYQEWKSTKGSGGKKGKKQTPDLPTSFFDNASTYAAFRKLLTSAKL